MRSVCWVVALDLLNLDRQIQSQISRCWGFTSWSHNYVSTHGHMSQRMASMCWTHDVFSAMPMCFSLIKAMQATCAKPCFKTHCKHPLSAPPGRFRTLFPQMVPGSPQSAQHDWHTEGLRFDGLSPPRTLGTWGCRRTPLS